VTVLMSGRTSPTVEEVEHLPLRPWMEISVTALAEHPNDPALSSTPAS
jgi:muconolactone delta-isomerase